MGKTSKQKSGDAAPVKAAKTAKAAKPEAEKSTGKETAQPASQAEIVQPKRKKVWVSGSASHQ